MKKMDDTDNEEDAWGTQIMEKMGNTNSGDTVGHR